MQYTRTGCLKPYVILINVRTEVMVMSRAAASDEQREAVLSVPDFKTTVDSHNYVPFPNIVSVTPNGESITEHCVFITQRRAFVAQHGVFRTQHGVFRTQHGVFRTQHGVFRTRHRDVNTERLALKQECR